MPSRQVRSVDISEQIAALTARIVKLETFPTSGMTLVTSYSGSGGTITSTTPSLASGTSTPSFTLTRPVPLLIMATLTFQPVTYAGAGQGSVRLGLSSTLQAPNYSSMEYVSPTAGEIIVVPMGLLYAVTPPAGAYTASIYGFLTSGAPNYTVGAPTVLVFQLSG